MSKVTNMPETGKVVTGFSHFMVANYAANAGVVTYSNGRVASGAVDVNLSPEASEDNKYFTDNQQSESAGGKFTGGTAAFTVKGLFIDAERMMMGLPEASEDGWTPYGDDQKAPYLGTGYVVRYMCNDQEIFTPHILCKTKYDPIQTAAATQEEEIDWQSQSLNAQLFRGDDANHNWKLIGDDWTTEAEAITQLEAKFGVSHS